MFIPMWLLILLAVWLVVALSTHEQEQQAHIDELQDELDTVKGKPDPELLRGLW